MKVICPIHDDVNPSCEIYQNCGYCFVCDKAIPLSELGINQDEAPKEKYVEDLKAKRKYIESLPVKEVRGFHFHYDSLGYYIIWRDCDYYKLRHEAGPVRYKNPAGHSQPLFWVNKDVSETLCIVEGEINAMSLGFAMPEYDVCSPGSAGDMSRKNQERYLHEYVHYRKVILVVDEDGPGAVAAIKLKLSLLKLVPYISIIMMQKDCNEWLTDSGKDGLRREIELQMQKAL